MARRYSLSDLSQPIPAICAKCGGPATIYPNPAPHGACVCATCSPPWFVAFSAWLQEQPK